MNMTRFTLKRLAAVTLAVFAAVDQASVDSAEVVAGKDPSDLVDIRELAVGDGKTLCTAAIQTAIDRCAARGGGVVRLPAGNWLTGTVYLESE